MRIVDQLKIDLYRELLKIPIEELTNNELDIMVKLVDEKPIQEKLKGKEIE